MTEIKKIIESGESRTLEFKEFLPNSENIAKTLIAFANGAGGKLIIGVQDKTQKITGISDSDIFSYSDKLTSILHDRCVPDIIPEIYRWQVDDKIIIVVEVFPGSSTPYYLIKEGRDKGVYVRVGASTRKASPEQVQQLERKRANVSYDEVPLFECGKQDLDLEKLARDFETYTGRKLADKDLSNLHILTKEAGNIHPTVGGYLLAGTDEQKFFQSAVKCARFKGTTPDIFIDRKEFRGSIYEQAEQAMKFLQTHLELSGKVEGIQRKDHYIIPLEALREAVINAIVHRDYSISGADIKIAVFDDLVEITSPGTMPGALTTEDIGTGRSEIRNKVLARFFKEIAFIEQWGTGINKIIRICNDNNLPDPEFKESGNFFQTIFRKPPTSNGGLNEGLNEPNERLNEGLNEGLKTLLEAIINHPGTMAKDLSGLLENRPIKTLERQIKQLTDKNLIERRGSRKTGGYYLKKT
jgi:ATP-dependent DNA helicase RecG